MKRELKELKGQRKIEGYDEVIALGTQAIGRFTPTLNSLHGTITEMQRVLVEGVNATGAHAFGCLARGEAKGRMVQVQFNIVLLDTEEMAAMEAGTLTRDMLEAADVLDEVRESGEDMSVN